MSDTRTNEQIIAEAAATNYGGPVEHYLGEARELLAALAAAGRLVDNTPTEPEAADPAQYTQERAALRAQREAVGKRVGRDCDYEGCTRTVEDGALHRVNPRGRPGVFMCAEHFGEVNSWEQRVSDRGEKEDAAAGRLRDTTTADEVLVEGSYFDRADLPRILGNFMRATDEARRGEKDAFLRSEKARDALEASEAARANLEATTEQDKEYIARLEAMVERFGPVTARATLTVLREHDAKVLRDAAEFLDDSQASPDLRALADRIERGEGS